MRAVRRGGGDRCGKRRLRPRSPAAPTPTPRRTCPPGRRSVSRAPSAGGCAARVSSVVGARWWNRLARVAGERRPRGAGYDGRGRHRDRHAHRPGRLGSLVRARLPFAPRHQRQPADGAVLTRFAPELCAADPFCWVFSERGTIAGWSSRFACSWRGDLLAGAARVRGLSDGTRVSPPAYVETCAAISPASRPSPRLDRPAQDLARAAGARCRACRAGDDKPLRVLHVHSGRDYGGLERMLSCLGR